MKKKFKKGDVLRDCRTFASSGDDKTDLEKLKRMGL